MEQLAGLQPAKDRTASDRHIGDHRSRRRPPPRCRTCRRGKIRIRRAAPYRFTRPSTTFASNQAQPRESALDPLMTVASYSSSKYHLLSENRYRRLESLGHGLGIEPAEHVDPEGEEDAEAADADRGVHGPDVRRVRDVLVVGRVVRAAVRRGRRRACSAGTAACCSAGARGGPPRAPPARPGAASCAGAARRRAGACQRSDRHVGHGRRLHHQLPEPRGEPEGERERRQDDERRSSCSAATRARGRTCGGPSGSRRRSG